MVKLAEAKTIYLKTGPLDNFKIDFKKLEKAITKKTKAFVLNSPSNPTGSVYGRERV